MRPSGGMVKNDSASWGGREHVMAWRVRGSVMGTGLE